MVEDGDGAGVEALIHVLLRDLRVGPDRFLELAPTPMGIADFEPELGVTRIELEELLVLLERLVSRPLLGQLAGRFQDLSLVVQHARLAADRSRWRCNWWG